MLRCTTRLCLGNRLQRLSNAIVANYATEQSQRLSHGKPNESNNVFTQIYRFPHIVLARTLCRLKLYQTGITITTLPLTAVLYANDQTTLTTCTYFGAASVLALTVLYVVGNVFRRFVGVMYLNKTKDILKLSHLTFFGNRHDITVPVNDVIPFAELGENPKNIFYTLKLYSTGEKYFYIVKFGGVKHPEDFKLVVGFDTVSKKVT